MEFFAVEADSYENALKKARRRYGWNIVVHQRRDFYRGFLFLSKLRCEILCFIPQNAKKDDNEATVIDRFEFEAKTFKSRKSGNEDPQSQYARSLLEDNGFSSDYIDSALEALTSMIKDADNLSIEHTLYSYIRSVIDIDVQTQLYCPQALAILGLANSGKSLICSNLLALYTQRYTAEKVKLSRLEIGHTKEDVQASANAQHNIIDCFYPETKEDVDAIASVLSPMNPRYCLVIDASDPENLEQMDKLCTLFPFSCAAITKLDLAKDIGMSLSFLHAHGLKAYCLQDSSVPEQGFKLASASLLMDKVKSLRI